MNKTNMILICIIIALISGIIGFIIGINFKGNNEINSSSVSMKNEEKIWSEHIKQTHGMEKKQLLH